jgi:hypothetical protein
VLVLCDNDKHSFDKVACLVEDATRSPVGSTLPPASSMDVRRDMAPSGGTRSVWAMATGTSGTKTIMYVV